MGGAIASLTHFNHSLSLCVRARVLVGLLHLFLRLSLRFCLWQGTRAVQEMGLYDPKAWMSSLATLVLVCCVGGACAATVSVKERDTGEACCLAFAGLAILSALLCFAVSQPLAENWYMLEGASPVRFVDPELAAGLSLSLGLWVSWSLALSHTHTPTHRGALSGRRPRGIVILRPAQ